MSKNVLLVMLEFDNWTQARAWSYTGAYAFHDGLIENGHRCTLLPAITGQRPQPRYNYLNVAKQLLADERYDEAWIWCVHTHYDDDFWAWLEQVAPIRIGVVMESLTMGADEIADFPQFADRREVVYEQLRHCTHALLADELDVSAVEQAIGIPTHWNVPMVPERFVRFNSAPTVSSAAFIGSKYGRRREYLEDPSLSQQMIRPHLPERDSDLPTQFDSLHEHEWQSLQTTSPTRSQLDAFVSNLRAIRNELFELHLDGIRMGFANVNLPSVVRAYPGRVFESMAASTPVASWKVEERPACAQIFEDGVEIALFDTPLSLSTQLSRLRDDDDLRNRISTAARNTLLVRHTSRIRMRQYEIWLNGGPSSDFHSDIGYKPTTSESAYYRHLFSEVPSWSRPEPNRDEAARWEKIRLNIESAIPHHSHGREIVEIGCGRGWLSNLLTKYGHVTGTEPVGDVIAHAKKLFPHIRFITGSAEMLSFLGYSNQYDLLVCSEVIEHVPHAHKDVFARGLIGLVRPGGHLILTTPRKDIYEQWTAQYSKPQQPTEDWLTEAELQTLFENNGCTMLRLERAFLLDIYQIALFRRLL